MIEQPLPDVSALFPPHEPCLRASAGFTSLAELAAQLLDVSQVVICPPVGEPPWGWSGAPPCAEALSFCALLAAEGRWLALADAREEACLAGHPLVCGEPGIRFVAAVPLSLEPGRLLGSLCVFDSAPRRLDEAGRRRLQLLGQQAEQLLLLAEQRRLSDDRLARYQAITQGAAAGIVRIDGRGLIQEINDYALALLGYRRDELLGRNVSCMMPARWARHHDGYIRDYLRGGDARVIGTGRKVAARHKAGHQVPVHLAVSEVADTAGAGRREFIGILTDLTEIHQAEQRERQARAQAERASRAKTEFLSSMSHELRTPLNAIMGFAQLLQSNTRMPLGERQRRQVEQIYKSGGHLLTLIDEVLDLASIETGRLRMSLEAVHPAEAVHEACAILAPLAQQRGIGLDVAPELGSAGPVRADYTRLKQVLINLVSNAIKYNRPRGRVWVGCRPEPDALCILVRDSGFGIAPQHLDQLFQPFNRLGAEQGAIEGTGVGLALTKSIVEQMGGNIGLDNSPGDGCEFWFRLPWATPPTGPASAGRMRTLLYVAASPAGQQRMQEQLGELDGMQLLCLPSAELAFELACSSPPDLILMDLGLPGMGSLAAARLFGRHPLTSAIPLVALSAGASLEEAEQAVRAGFSDCLVPPLEARQWPVLLARLMESQR